MLAWNDFWIWTSKTYMFLKWVLYINFLQLFYFEIYISTRWGKKDRMNEFLPFGFPSTFKYSQHNYYQSHWRRIFALTQFFLVVTIDSQYFYCIFTLINTLGKRFAFEKCSQLYLSHDFSYCFEQNERQQIWKTYNFIRNLF